MRTNLLIKVLLMGATMTAPLAAQVVPAAESGSSAFHLNIAATYSPARFSDVKGSGFWVQGGSIQLQAKLGSRLGLVTDARSFYTSDIKSAGVGLTLITATAGPRYTLPITRNISVFGQGLFGRAMALDGLFPHGPTLETTANSFALLAGGGLEMRLSRRLSVRAIEANRMRTHLPNGANNVQNALLLGGGVVYWFK